MPWASLNLAAQAAYLEHLRKAPGAEVVERAGVYAVRTRVRSNTENGVVSSAGSHMSRALAEDLADWFGEWGVPASWLCAEGEERAVAAAALEAAGYRSERSAWEMRARIDALDLGAPADPGIARVASAAELERWLDIAAACRWCETEEARSNLRTLYAGLGLGRDAALRHYVATRGGESVGMASAFFDGGVVLLAAVAVIPGARRLGVGRALALARLREARERGCRLALLSPTPDGAKLYEPLGFEEIPVPADRWFYAPLREASAPGGA